MSQFAMMPALVVLAAGAVAAVTDIWRFKVYNLLTFPFVLSGLAYHGLTDGVAGLGASLGGILFAFVILIFPYVMGAMGAGDVKFLAGVGAWLGTEPLLAIVLIGSGAAVIYGVALMCYYGMYRETWLHIQLLIFRFMALGRQLGANDDIESTQSLSSSSARRHRLIPFSAMISVGVLITFLIAVLSK